VNFDQSEGTSQPLQGIVNGLLRDSQHGPALLALARDSPARRRASVATEIALTPQCARSAARGKTGSVYDERPPLLVDL
jgi:hypothetical protein